MKYAIVNSGIVDNIIEWDGSSEYNAEGVLVEADDNAKIGGSWDGNKFTFVEPEPEPDTRTYAEKRQAEYPPIGDQLDALFHAGVFPEEMAAQLQSVKDAHPKP